MINTEYKTYLTKILNNLKIPENTPSSFKTKTDIEKIKNITFIDFSLPSNKIRLFTYNINNLDDAIFQTYVTHGSGSGGVYATSFSNTPDSHKSSLGVAVTEGTYWGKNGYSCQLNGLEPGFNSNMITRSIVIHGANYIGDGKTGRSWGCTAIPMKVHKEYIDLVKDGNILFLYYPDSMYLNSSKLLK